MCYSAQVQADLRRLVREYGAVLSYQRFAELLGGMRGGSGWQRIPKAMRSSLAGLAGESVAELAQLVEAGEALQANVYEAELFQQKTRLAGAERILAEKPTKKAENDRRVATDKIERAQRNLADLRRTELLPRDARIFPGSYAPVIVEKDGKRIAVPMRYQCRLPGWTPEMERKMPGTYNARRDNLEKAWRKLFGYRHGILVVDAFYENVALHTMEHRELAPGEHEENVVLEFRPETKQPMLVACLWSFTKGGQGEQDLLSFAAITDEPPAEVAAAGHDRCIVPVKEQNLSAWLNPDPADISSQYAILDDRQRPFYEHRKAA